jgi:dTDP-4-amino-4,6-dideoxygalactose transaminase
VKSSSSLQKIIPVAKPFLPPLGEYVAHLEQVWESEQLTNNGSLVQKLEQELAQCLGVEHLVLVSNGTLALQLALKVFDISDGEVITTPFSYVATTTSLLWERCSPVFADIDSESLCLDPHAVEKVITSRTRAILATHVYGRPCDHERLLALAESRNIKLIYDAAHAFGVKKGGASILNWGHASTLSFHATKLFHTAEGGAVIVRDPAHADRLRLLRAFGHVQDAYFEPGINAKLSELHAAMGLAVLPHLAHIRAEREIIASRYDESIRGSTVCRPLDWPHDIEANYSYYPVLFLSEDNLLRTKKALEQQSIVARRYFYPSLNQLPYVQAPPCPVSEDISRRVLCLPLWTGLDVERVIQHLKI